MKKLYLFFTLLPLLSFAEIPEFSETYVSRDQVTEWLAQFDKEDQDTAQQLVESLDFYTYSKLQSTLKELHSRLLDFLLDQSFITERDDLEFNNVDFSRTYTSKSGDLISYHYRSANKVRAVCFKNLSELYSNSEDKSGKCLVILDDYVSSGTQFLLERYARNHHTLFNQYKKVVLVLPIVGPGAVSRFTRIQQGDHASVAKEFIQIMQAESKSEKEEITAAVKRIDSSKLELIYVNQEKPLIQEGQNSSQDVVQLLEKYNIVRYLGGSYSTMGRTVFFYNCPNNLPEILWNTKSKTRDGAPWKPLFRRVEDLSIYQMADNVPVEEQIWQCFK